MGKLVHITTVNSNRFTDEMIDIDEVITFGNAEPTSRVLDGSSDHGYAQEWTEDCNLPDGRKGQVVYLFSDEDLLDKDGEPIEDVADLPFDNDHVRRIRLTY